MPRFKKVSLREQLMSLDQVREAADVGSILEECNLEEE